MQHSEAVKDLATALAKAQAEIENATKNAENPHYRSSYADLAEVLNTVRPVLSKHGLSVVQIPGFDPHTGTATLDTMLMHTSGQWIAGQSGAPLPKLDPQGVGGATTYLRRYSLAALCGIAQEDDDANEASQPSKRSHAKPAAAEPDADFDAAAFMASKAPGKKAEGRTWNELLTTEDGRGYIRWAIQKMERLTFEQRQALERALDDASAGPIDTVKLQDTLNRALNVDAVSEDDAHKIEGVIDRADPDELARAATWLNTQIEKRRLNP